MANPGGSARASSSSPPSSSSPTVPPQERRAPLPRTPSAVLLPPPPPPLHITIRFSTALPDLHLDIPAPQQTTVVALKHLIRDRLAAVAAEEEKSNDAEPPSKTPDGATQPPPTPAAEASLARLRFIHNGRILPDPSALSAVLKAPPPPPPRSHASPAAADPKGKSRADAHTTTPQQRVFINCSIGAPLPASDLAAEATAASLPPAAQQHQQPTPSPSSRTPPPPPNLRLTTTNLPLPSSGPSPPGTQQSSGPLGFDRLLTAGLTPPEIATLRSHFRAIHTARFTPDAMPSPDALRRMEDAWLDNDRGVIPTTTSHAAGGGGDYGSGGDEDGEGVESGMGEDAFGLSAVAGPLIQGMLIGFVFPLGVVGWLGKEEGVWSSRMQVFVVFGVLLSLSVGLVRGLTGEG